MKLKPGKDIAMETIIINEERLKNTFIELVSVPCPSGDEKEEAALLAE